MKKRCRHKTLEQNGTVIKCKSCGKVWLKQKGDEWRDLSMRAGGSGEN